MDDETANDGAGETAQWATLTTCATHLDADLARQTLDAEGIPVLARGDHVGIFGAGFQGPVGSGVELLVPEPELARARELLGLDAEG